MNTEDFLKSKEITTFEKLVVYILQDHIISTAKDLASLFDINEVTAKKALSNLKKAGLIKKEKVAILLPNNEKGSEKATFDNPDEKIESSENTTFLDKKVAKKLLIDKKGSDFTTFLEKTLSIYIINTDLININSINSGKLSLTSFASASLEDYTVKFNSVNDPDHRNINQIQNSLIPTKPAKTDIAEIVKAPATQKKPRKTKAPFQPPTYDMVLGFMAAYVHQEQNNFPELIEINLNIEAKKYMNFYSGKDWRLGVIRMTDWRIQASNWLMGKVERITEGKIKIKKNQQYIQEAFGDSFLNSQNIVDLNQVQNADGTITAETPAIQTSFPVFQQTKTKEQLKKETDDFIQKHKSGEVL